ncbi:MAG TPA: DsrE family protein [Bacteroidota bacterium]|nr:DsrE family protein [Bacteroidota bacterium]
MKRILAVLFLAMMSLGLVHAQDKPYKVVFDLTSRDSLDQKAVMRWLKEISDASPDAQMEVVMYGKGLELVMPEKSTMLPEVKEAMKNPNISFKVCQIAMKNLKVDKSQLLDGAQPVPDGVHEIVMKQQDNWGYIKVSH